MTFKTVIIVKDKESLERLKLLMRKIIPQDYFTQVIFHEYTCDFRNQNLRIFITVNPSENNFRLLGRMNILYLENIFYSEKMMYEVVLPVINFPNQSILKNLMICTDRIEEDDKVINTILNLTKIENYVII